MCWYFYLLNYMVIFLDLTDTQKEFQQLAHKFTKEEIIPNAPKYDQTGEVCSHGFNTFCYSALHQTTLYYSTLNYGIYSSME